MDKNFQLEIISLTHPSFSEKVTSVTVPSIDGELTLMAHHIPLITLLKAGEITLRQGDREAFFAISSGFLVVDPNHVSILADSVEKLEELNEEKIRIAKENAEKLLTEKKFSDDRSFADVTATLEKSLAHLHILKKHRSHSKGPRPE